MGGSAVTVSNGGLGGSGAAAWDATGGWSHDFGMRKVSVGIWSAWLGNAASWCRSGLFGGWASNWAALEGDADLLGVLFVFGVFIGAITSVVAIVLSDLLVDGVHDDTGDWGINLLKHVAGGIKGGLGSIAVFGDDKNFVNEGGHDDRVGHAVTWGTIEDDDIEMILERIDKLFVFLGAEELRWVWWVSTTGDDVEVIDRSLLDVVAEVDDLIHEKMAQTLNIWGMEDVVQAALAEIAVYDEGALAALGEGDSKVGAYKALALRSERRGHEDGMKALIDAGELKVSTKRFDAFGNSGFWIALDDKLVWLAATARTANVGLNNFTNDFFYRISNFSRHSHNR